MLGLKRLTIVVALFIAMKKDMVATHTPLLSKLVWDSHKRFLMRDILCRKVAHAKRR